MGRPVSSGRREPLPGRAGGRAANTKVGFAGGDGGVPRKGVPGGAAPRSRRASPYLGVILGVIQIQGFFSYFRLHHVLPAAVRWAPGWWDRWHRQMLAEPGGDSGT